MLVKSEWHQGQQVMDWVCIFKTTIKTKHDYDLFNL